MEDSLKDEVLFYKIENYTEEYIEANADNPDIVDWELISEHGNLFEFSDEFLDKFSCEFDWWQISKRGDITIKFAKRFKDKLDWEEISDQTYSEDFLEEFKDHIIWNYIFSYSSYTNKFSEAFLIRNVECYDNDECWSDISSNQDLTENFMEMFKDKVNWFLISVRQHLSEVFIRKHKDKVIWSRIILYQNHLSEDFLWEMREYIDFKQALNDGRTFSSEFGLKLYHSNIIPSMLYLFGKKVN